MRRTHDLALLACHSVLKTAGSIKEFRVGLGKWQKIAPHYINRHVFKIPASGATPFLVGLRMTVKLAC